MHFDLFSGDVTWLFAHIRQIQTPRCIGTTLVPMLCRGGCKAHQLLRLWKRTRLGAEFYSRCRSGRVTSDGNSLMQSEMNAPSRLHPISTSQPARLAQQTCALPRKHLHSHTGGSPSVAVILWWVFNLSNNLILRTGRSVFASLCFLIFFNLRYE